MYIYIYSIPSMNTHYPLFRRPKDALESGENEGSGNAQMELHMLALTPLN